MTNKKTQSTSQRKNRSSQGDSKNKNATKSTSSQTEVEDLKRKYSELQSKNNELESKNNELTKQILQYQIDQLGTPQQSLNDDNESQSEVISDDSTPTAKRQMRKKPSDDDENAKFLIKKLLEYCPPDLNLKYDLVFTSNENTEICEKLIPRLQKDAKSAAYNLSYEQVKKWLKNIHQSKRRKQAKSIQSNHNEIENSQEAESDDARSAKRQTKSKGKKPDNLSEDDEGAKNEESKIEDAAKIIMKAYLNKVSDLSLKDDLFFTSKENFEICEKLIPKLQEELKPMYNLSHQQVKKWLKNFHQSKRRNYMKSNQMEIDK